MTHVLKVLIADDSATARQLLVHIVNSAMDMQVVGEAQDGRQAVKMVAQLKPDVILMDLVMPRMDGLQATCEIMAANPTPIVVISASLESPESAIAFDAMRCGALTVVRKPNGPLDGSFADDALKIQSLLRAMAGVRVIHHRKLAPTPPQPSQPVSRLMSQPRLVAIVASTGGPAALCKVLEPLPSDFPTPIVIVQHISPEFMPSLVGWLSSVTRLTVSIAEEGQQPLPGNVYFAPSQSHLKLTRYHRFELLDAPALYVPSGNILLESVAQAYLSGAIGIVLTGMGSDGAQGLRAMRGAGALTIAQDEATSAVYGMPREAQLLDAAQYILPLDEIGSALITLVHRKENRHGHNAGYRGQPDSGAADRGPTIPT